MPAIAAIGKLTASIIGEFRNIAGEEHVYLDEESLNKYGHDETENLLFLPEIVIKPRTAEEISRIMIICNREKIPVTPRGAGTGLSGGALPHLGGVLLSTERMNSILDIDERNLQVTTEPGVITENLQNSVKEKGLFYPPDPSSRGSCFIGGNISEKSGGPKNGKYGVGKDYCLKIEKFLPTGENSCSATCLGGFMRGRNNSGGRYAAATKIAGSIRSVHCYRRNASSSVSRKCSGY